MQVGKNVLCCHKSHKNYITENVNKGAEYAFKDFQDMNVKVSFVNLLVNLQFLRLQFT